MLLPCAVVLLLLLGCCAGAARAQEMEARITVLNVSTPRVRIEGRRADATRVWSFRNAYGSLLGLGERIENLSLKDEKGGEVAVTKLAAGEYEAAREAVRWSYEVRLDAPTTVTNSAYASWLVSGRGLLMLGDLLPLMMDEKLAGKHVTRVQLELPAGWSALSIETRLPDGNFEVADVTAAVFFIGTDLRERRERVGQMEFSVAASGTWAFSDQDVMSMAASILKDYAQRTGSAPRVRAMLMLSPFPRAVGAERWSAETRGGTVMLLSGQSPSKVAALAQLSSPLTHELFHLWVPNGLRLEGNYDWFYEGFTLYQALVAGVRLHFLTFQDYLNALARAFDAYQAASRQQQLSLLEASRRRWTGSPALVYQKGMLVAFLYDLSLRQASRGKRELDDVYRALFQQAGAARRDGNEVLLALLNGQEGMLDFTRRYVESASEIELSAAVAPLGLRVERIGARTTISADGKLTRQQRDLWRAFGYNEDAQRALRRVSS
ncbi:MAG: hypothetical protein JO360_16795 [Acidobacteria bacterium]|nr:hypothetical protein [Acidobacteriota bacterium]